MNRCDEVQERLAELGTSQARTDQDIQHHLETCAGCGKALNDLRRVEAALQDLPAQDAPDALVADTLDAVRREAAKKPAPLGFSMPRRYLAGGLAASVVLVAGLGLLLTSQSPLYQAAPPAANLRETFHGQFEAKDEVAGGPVAHYAPLPSELASEEPRSRVDTSAESPDESEATLETAQVLAKKAKPEERRSSKEDQAGSDASPLPEGEDEVAFADRYRNESSLVARLVNKPQFGERSAQFEQDQHRIESNDEVLVEFGRYAPLDELAAGEKREAEQKSQEAPAGVVGGLSGQGSHEAEDLDRASEFSRGFLADQRAAGATELAALPDAELLEGAGLPDENRRLKQRKNLAAKNTGEEAKAFLASARSLEGLAFQEPAGYWANSYIPGDPAMRLLQARLKAWNRTALGQNLPLEQSVAPVVQPFDAPRDGAMAVYLHTDQAAIDGPTRLRLQVGLQGAERQGGHRPAMNIGLVVDLRSLEDAASGAKIRALIAALERARQPGDRFSLTVAGETGGLLVAPEQFRHGPLRVALERMFSAEQAAGSTGVTLPQAVVVASESLTYNDDPTAVLGSSLVLLVTGSSLAGDLAALEGMAHHNAVAGLTLSVVSLGTQNDLSQIDRLVAAGQGTRRILDSAQAAEVLVDRELHSASSAVARALRLRIRLAPGVKLIDVLGSRRLEEPQAQRVREAEQAIDQRLARNLGIQADRGEDEEGIQIVIPNFHAGDSHVILLDLVAQASGPLAEVTLRYKDVIQLRNGVAHASLAIDEGPATAGPLHRNVLKNHVAWEFARQIRQAGRHLDAGEPQTAAALIAQLRDLILGLRREVAGWSSDAGLASDQSLLDEYLAVLTAPAANDTARQQFLAETLRYTAFRKLQPAGR